MVAIINSSTSIRRTFLYNDNKQKEGLATCLLAKNYPMDLQYMTEHHRLNMLLRTAEKNPNVSRNSVHISLNFAPDEVIDNDKMIAIAQEYMQLIGFAQQPYLLYRHFDAAHPHCHIVTTKIRTDGTKIDMQNIGKLVSEPARKLLENKYDLVRAEDHRRHLSNIIPVDITKAQYGKTETKRAIGNILSKVLKQYRFTSIPELNAVLNLYNVGVDQGDEGSRMNELKGLNYHLIDEHGYPIGVPIKASLFHDKPTLKNIEKSFLKNDVERLPYKARIASAIDFVIKTKKPASLQALTQLLLKEGLRLIPRQNKDGEIYGITFIDLKSKVVFNGSALGKNYSAKAIFDRLGIKKALDNMGEIAPKQKANTVIKATKSTPPQPPILHNPPISLADKSILELLLTPEFVSQSLPAEWKRRKKKRKR